GFEYPVGLYWRDTNGVYPVRQSTAYLLCIACSHLVVGCFPADPVRTTRQTARLRVVESASGSPIAGAHVQLKIDFDRYDDILPKDGRVAGAVRQTARASWEQEPWSSFVADRNGQAEATIVRTAIDRTRGKKPAPDRNVTGEPYLVKVKSDYSGPHFS